MSESKKKDLTVEEIAKKNGEVATAETAEELSNNKGED